MTSTLFSYDKSNVGMKEMREAYESYPVGNVIVVSCFSSVIVPCCVLSRPLSGEFPALAIHKH